MIASFQLRRMRMPIQLFISVWLFNFGFPVTALAVNGPSIFFNEIHYDNVGSDRNEGIEIAGTSGTDLEGWQLLFYNGNGGNLYKSLALTGIIPDSGAGIGVLSFETSGLQNGPDGVALSNNLDQVVQFLSYEGSFSATEGAADGLSSEQISPFEGADSDALSSLQLTGSGIHYSDFQWSGPQLSSFGEINQGQQFIAPTTVPLPATLPLLLSGIAGFSVLARRRKL